MILKMCAKCKRPVVYPATYCERCQVTVDSASAEIKRLRKAKSDKRYDREKRDKKTDAFYHSPAWKALAARHMQDYEYRCAQCGGVATQVHHKTPISTPEGWTMRYVYDGLEDLCDRCHNKAHQRFSK